MVKSKRFLIKFMNNNKRSSIRSKTKKSISHRKIKRTNNNMKNKWKFQPNNRSRNKISLMLKTFQQNHHKKMLL